MNETTATHPEEVVVTLKYDGFEMNPIPIGWLCPRCGAVNAPDVKRCDCEPEVEDNRHYVLGPSETK